MNILARLILSLISIVVLIFIMYKIRKKRIHIHYAIYWTFLSLALVIVSIWPQFLFFVTEICNVEVPVHVLLMGIIILLIIKSFNDTIRISELERKMELLTQEIALDNFDDRIN